MDKSKTNVKPKLCIIVTKPTNELFVKQCDEISKQNVDDDPAFGLDFDQFKGCDYLLLAIIKEKVVGFTIITKIYPNILYISGIAIRNEYKRMGIGSKMIKYIEKHSKNHRILQSHVLHSNIKSINFHLKLGFVQSYDNILPLYLTFSKTINQKRNYKELNFTLNEDINSTSDYDYEK